MPKTPPAVPDHFCPGCGKQLSYGPRTPWYFCGACLNKATDGRGQPIQFIGLGAEWCYREGYGPDAHDRGVIGVICLILNRPVIVHEARQGGPVAEPVYKDHFSRLQSQSGDGGSAWKIEGVVDLTETLHLDRVVKERLVHPGRRLRY